MGARAARAALLALLAASCAAPGPRAGGVEGSVGGDVETRRTGVDDRTVRVALATAAAAPRVGSVGAFWIVAADGRTVIGEGQPGTAWRIERQGRLVRAVRPDGAVTAWLGGPLRVRPARADFVTHEGKRYRGELALHVADSGVAVVNHLRLDDYLLGVVPLEIGRTRTEAERAAVEAQAVAARSYAAVRLPAGATRPWDLRGSVLDQAYGGVDAETPVATRAVQATRGLVLRYGGRTVDAPYSASCGGTTAAGSEVWRAEDRPYLRAVVDRDPRTGRDWCEAAPRHRWTATLERDALNATVQRYLRNYASVPPGGPGAVRAVAVASRTPSGRVGSLRLATDRGTWELRGNGIRFTLRTPGGEILHSTYFSAEAQPGADGSVARLTLRGQGNGHGVGMCQWGAIGRARAGHDFRSILNAYYPGAVVAAEY